MKRHIEAKHGSSSYNCDICNFTTKEKYHLQHHTKQKHLKKDLFECPKCSKKFCRKDVMKVHFKTIHEGQTFSCDLCSHVSTQKGELLRHKNSIHTKLAKKYDCSFCGKSLTSPRSLKNHVDSIHLRIIHSCSECEFKTKNQSLL